MKNFLDYKVILWDFDGVIMDSMPIRSSGFRVVLSSYPDVQVEKLMQYHEANGGLSRYVKFRYFFEEILGETVSEEIIQQYAAAFSNLMLSKLIDANLLISDSFSFIKANFNRYDMHIVSGSDGSELLQICNSLGISKYFSSINGSPTAKKVLVKDLILKNGHMKSEVCLIGDSVNDAEASEVNEIAFFAYNNKILQDKYQYINTFGDS